MFRMNDIFARVRWKKHQVELASALGHSFDCRLSSRGLMSCTKNLSRPMHEAELRHCPTQNKHVTGRFCESPASRGRLEPLFHYANPSASILHKRRWYYVKSLKSSWPHYAWSRQSTVFRVSSVDQWGDCIQMWSVITQFGTLDAPFFFLTMDRTVQAILGQHTSFVYYAARFTSQLEDNCVYPSSD